ncbi:hypothetical protein BJ508DRAFT_324786 [Ascobolus immersus RN42]|uniref:Uncharacterized protein n=1 Tax=Ascobolus immersus RN42 TaxID=1160509 RepID=A0A3N4ICM3_ASCIM|nr:hypothetical protein BJ508DRAFT_324786 [Ascobolus immersus RN42]
MPIHIKDINSRVDAIIEQYNPDGNELHILIYTSPDYSLLEVQIIQGNDNDNVYKVKWRETFAGKVGKVKSKLGGQICKQMLYIDNQRWDLDDLQAQLKAELKEISETPEKADWVTLIFHSTGKRGRGLTKMERLFYDEQTDGWVTNGDTWLPIAAQIGDGSDVE